MWLIAVCIPAYSTTKGLNQIVTPDIQPRGALSLSVQGQDSAIGNPEQLQLELGITKTFEVALFRGFSPGETAVAAELGIIRRKPFLVSAGVLGIEDGLKPQPFIEGGYYRGKGFLVGGIQQQEGIDVAMLGAGYQVTSRVMASVDHLGGSANFTTAGITLTLTPTVSFNPAIYVTNSKPRRTFGYGVLSWNVTVR